MCRPRAGIALITLLLLPTFGLGQDRQQRRADPAALVAKLADPAGHEAAARGLRKLGRPAWEPLRRAALATKETKLRQRMLELWEELVGRSAQKLLKGRVDNAGQKLSWTLEVRSELIPYLRCYKAQGTRYPMAVVLDLREGVELRKVDQETMNLMLKRARPRCRSRRVARQVAELFIGLKYQPYSATKSKITVRRGRGGHVMTGRFTRTLPWSSPDRPMIVTSRTEERRIKLSLSRRCRFRQLAETVGKTVYSK
jgi:hypothetical protein